MWIDWETYSIFLGAMAVFWGLVLGIGFAGLGIQKLFEPKNNTDAVPPDGSATIHLLKSENENSRFGAAIVQKYLGDPAAVPALIEALKDESEKVREAVADALEKIGTPAAKEAVAAYKKEVAAEGDKPQYFLTEGEEEIWKKAKEEIINLALGKSNDFDSKTVGRILMKYFEDYPFDTRLASAISSKVKTEFTPEEVKRWIQQLQR